MTLKRPLSCRLHNAVDLCSSYISEYTDFCSTDLDSDDDGEEVSSPPPADINMLSDRRHSHSFRSFDSRIQRVPAMKAPKKTKVQDMASAQVLLPNFGNTEVDAAAGTYDIIPEDIDRVDDEEADDGCCGEGKEQFISMMMESLGAVIRSENGGPACSSTCSSTPATSYRRRIESRSEPFTDLAGSNPTSSTESSDPDPGSNPTTNTSNFKPSTSFCSSSLNHHLTETPSFSISDESTETQQLHNYNSDVELEIQQLLAQASAECSSSDQYCNDYSYGAEMYQDPQLWRPSEYNYGQEHLSSEYCNSVVENQNIKASVNFYDIDTTKVDHDHDHDMQGFCSMSDIGLMNMSSCTEPLNPLSLYSLNSPLYLI